MKKNKEPGRLTLPYLEEEIQPRRIPAWVVITFTVFVFSVLLFPFYA